MNLTSSSNRLLVIGAVLLIVVIAALGWFVGVSPQLDAAKAADESRSDVEAQNDSLELSLIALQKDFENIDAYRSELAGLRKEIPQTASMAEFVATLNAVAAKTGVTVTDVTPGVAAPFVLAEGEAAEGADASATNVFYIPMSVSVAGDENQVLAFIQAMQSGSARLFLISDLRLADDEGVTVSQMSGAVYVLTDPDAPQGDSLLVEEEPVEESAESETPAP